MAETIKVTHHYDADADILYIDFGSAEPCFTEDLDGFLMIDIGWFSKLPRGARFISPRARNVRSISMIIAKVEKSCKQLIEQQVNQLQTTEPVLESLLDSKINEAFASVN